MAADTPRAAPLESSDPRRLSPRDVAALVAAFVVLLVVVAMWPVPVGEGLGEGLRQGATGVALTLLAGVLVRMMWRYAKPKARRKAQEFLGIRQQNR